jgi:hypothetical protein
MPVAEENDPSLTFRIVATSRAELARHIWKSKSRAVSPICKHARFSWGGTTHAGLGPFHSHSSGIVRDWLHRVIHSGESSLPQEYEQQSTEEERHSSSARQQIWKVILQRRQLEVNESVIRFLSWSSRTAFEELARQWREETSHLSNLEAVYLNRAYQKIIGMGVPALPFIFEALERKADLWFWALTAITRHEPFKGKQRISIERMRSEWLKWGRERGFV